VICFFYFVLNKNKVNTIKKTLKSKGVKQTWLAQRLEKSYNMVNGYVQNRRQPSLEDLYKIAIILDVDIKELIVSNKDE
jgi:putative transcriptional regulator